MVGRVEWVMQEEQRKQRKQSEREMREMRFWREGDEKEVQLFG